MSNDPRVRLRLLVAFVDGDNLSTEDTDPMFNALLSDLKHLA